MQTTRTLDRGTTSEDRSRLRAIGANLIVVGALGALAAVALLILVADPGDPVSTSPGPRPRWFMPRRHMRPVPQIRTGPGSATSSRTTPLRSRKLRHDRSWPGEGSCADGLPLDTQTAPDK